MMLRLSRSLALMLAAVAVVLPVRANAQSQTTLAQLQFDIVGVRLVVDPPTLTVPKQIATQINTSLVLPAGAGVDAREALATLTQGALVEGTLRGPQIPPMRITTRPGEPLPLPAFALPGDYFLDGLRLVKDGVALLDATAPDGRPATTIPIAVISEIFVTTVTSRPLSLDEIKQKGIVIDQNNFQAVNFQVAFNIDGQPFTIQMPVALPTRELLAQQPNRELLIRQLSVANQQLQGLQTTLPPQFDRPGLNFSIAAMPFFPTLEDADDPSFNIPPVTGLVVIPGNVAFLNQFFSVMLMVSNVAPDGTPLVLRDVKGTIALPTGLDRVAGASYENPGDDPLRVARVDGVGQRATVNVVQVGPDGALGTADDIASLPPQTKGDGEFLLEGLKEGGHIFDIRIEAVLDGLPSGPVSLVGQAAGAVFVRNPTFAVTLAHPRTVRSGEPYDIYATVTNTSRSPANLVSINLDPLGISGAQLVSDPGVSFETIAAGQSATARFRLVAQQTGEVTASSFTGEADGGIRLFTGVGERGVPLAPNAIVLPGSTSALPGSLVAAAQRVLGQAFSIATAPAEALPPDVLFVRRQTVIDRGLELAEAGQRLQFGDTLARAMQDLLLDWLGSRQFDAGFDQLLRTTDAGRAFLDEIGTVLGPSFAANALSAQESLVEQALARTAPLTAVVRGAADRAPVRLVVRRTDGAEISSTTSTLARGAAVTLPGSSSRGALAIAVAPDPAIYTIEAISPDGGTIDLGVTAPSTNANEGRRFEFGGIALDPGGVVRVLIDLSSPGAVNAQIDRNGDGLVDTTMAGVLATLREEPLAVVDVLQLQSSFFEAPGNIRDPATYGLLVGVLFNKPTLETSVETTGNYQIESNAVAGVSQQTGGRLAYLYLERPVGGLVPRALTIRDISDVHGQLLGSTTRPIRMVLSDGGRVFGQVREANGNGVPSGFLSATVVLGPEFSFQVSAIRTDAQGSFDFDFVPRIGTVMLQAQHPQTLALATLQARIRGAGESLLLNPTFQGSGTVRGRVLAADGVTPVPAAVVALYPGSVFSSRGLQAIANALGEFTFSGVPVGVFTVRAIDNRRASGQSTGVLQHAGTRADIDIVVLNEPSSGGTLVGRVLLSDGATPAANFSILIGSYNRRTSTIAAVDQTRTDSTGTFAFSASLPAGGYDVVAVDEATGQLGSTRASVVALTTTSVSIVMETTGAVQGVVFSASGQPVPGALVAGGLTLVTTDANGFFRIEGVPAGRREIQAGDPVTRRRGSANVDVLPGQTVVAAVTLEARATITGRVLDANGNPVPRASVRLPQLGGFLFVIANNQGVYTFPDMPLGDYTIQSPGPSAEALVGFLEANGYDPNVAFTSGDGPDTPPVPAATDANAVIAAYQNAVQTFFSVDHSLLGLPDAQLGGFGWNRVRLFQDAVAQTADVRFLPQGAVSGRTVDSAGRPTGALVRISALKVGNSGSPSFGEIARLNSDPATGAFSFNGVARFDLATFQTAGVRGGDYTLEAAQQFSPTIIQFRDQLNTANPNRGDVTLAFPAASETNGTASGMVLMPDGITPAPAGTQVQISFGDLTVTTNAEGRFVSLLPIPAGSYSFTAQTPTGGLRGRATALVPAGGNVDVTVRLLGLGSVLVQVRRPNGDPVPGAIVHVRRGTFPNDQADGTADGSASRRFVNLSEGSFSADVEEPISGLRGRASGIITRDNEAISVVTITASGRVTGAFVSASTNAPIPFAQVTLSGPVQAYTTTDASGRFELAAIPIGPFTVEASDPASGRLGRASGQMSFEGQVVDVTVVQLPRGTVAGYVLNADGVSGIPGAAVEISASGITTTRLQVTTRADGSFRIEGVSAGAFTLRARDPQSGAEGSTDGTLSIEAETVDRNVVLQPFGSIRVAVLDEQGQPAANASLTMAGRTAAVDTSGRFTFENLTLGTYEAVAVSLADAHNGGRATVVLGEANEIAEVIVNLRGVAPVTVRVVAADGATPVAAARVTLNAKGSFGGERPGPAATELIGFTDGTGDVTFPSVPLGDYFVRGESGPLTGIATGTTPGLNQSSAVVVTLGASGSITGRVVLPDGVTAAARAIVTLNFQSQSGLQSGVLQVTTNLTGQFQFSGIPIGAFNLTAFELVSSGVRARSGGIASNGQIVDLGDVTLDNVGPRVAGVTPADGAAGVSPTSPIVLTFTEPMLPSSVSTLTLTLMDGAAAVPGAVQVSTDRVAATFTPVQPLRSGAFYTMIVRGAPDGPRDDSNIAMVDPFVSGFAVRDVIAPAIVSLSPAANAREVQPEAVVRVAFSEPVAGGVLTLRDAGGQLVPAQTAFTNGGTVVVLSPLNFLPANGTFTASLTGVTDSAGNALAGGPASFTFRTVDTIAPLVTALAIQGATRAGALITLVPTIAGADVARVEYVFGSVSSVALAAPFAAAISVPGGAPDFSITVRAIDEVGNRSAAFVQTVSVQENLAPTLQLVNVAGQATVAQGATLAFDVVALDDVGIAQVLLSSVGAVTASFTDDLAGAPTSASRRFNISVPVDAAPGGAFTIQAAVIDTAGNRSDTSTIALAVRDGVAPVVTIQTPGASAQAVPGQVLTVIVNAADSGGLSSMTLTCNPALDGCETRTITSSPASTTQTFSVQVPQSLNAPASISISATASDLAGNTGQAGRSIAIADVLAPSLNGLQSTSGSTRVLAGTSATVRADALDNVAVAALDFTVEGAIQSTGTVNVAPPAASASAQFAFEVPASAPNGGTIVVRARARDAAGNASSELALNLTVGDTAPPALSVAQPVEGLVVTPGQSIAVQSLATDDVGVSQVVLRVRGVLTFDETRTFTPATTPAAANFTVPSVAATPAGGLTVTLQAFDAAGNTSAELTRVLTVRDANAPVVSIDSPAAGAGVDPRSPLAVSVHATDSIGVAEIGLSTTGLMSSTSTRPISPAAAAHTELFEITFSELPASGGQLTLTGSARDGAGNQSASTPVTIAVLDVVPPAVTVVTPANAATGVETTTAVVIQFSEPLDRASVVGAAVRLLSGESPIVAAITVAADDRSVTLTPQSTLAINTLHTVSVAATVRDRAGNPLPAAFTSSFRTASPDTAPPTVVSANPPAGSVGIGTTAPLSVTFSEPIAAGSVTAESFRVTANNAPVAGSFGFANGGATVSFLPAADLPFDTTVVLELSGAIADLSNNHLTNADGSAITTPITFTYLTGAFAIVSPSGGSVIENSLVTFEANGAASLAVSSVVFTVAGTAQPPVTAPPFTRSVRTPLATASTVMTVIASARDASNNEIARAERTYAVLAALSATPTMLGLSRGESGTIRLSLAQAVAADLAIALAAVDPSVVAVAPSVTLPAGATAIDVPITACTTCPADPPSRPGAAVGNTSVVATSSRGSASTVISVSDPVSGQSLNVSAPAAGLAIALPASAGQLVTTSGVGATTSIAVLSANATAVTPVTVSSSNPAVASATATDVAPGSRTTTLSIVSGTNGVAVLTVRAGSEVRSFTVFVGTPPADRSPIALALAVGVAIPQPPSSGQVVSSSGRSFTTTVPLLALANDGAAINVVVTSSAPGVATATASVIAQGSRTTTLSIVTGVDGTAVLTLRAGDTVRTLTVIVGTPQPNQTPAVFARAVGLSMPDLPFVGQASAPLARSITLGVVLLPEPAAVDTLVTVTSSNASIAQVINATVMIAAGSRVVAIDVNTGTAGTAVLTLEANGFRREFAIRVGTTPDPANTPVATAQAIGVSVVPLPGGGRVIAPAGAPLTATLGVQLLASPAATATSVTITSGNPAIVSLGAGASVVTIDAGGTVAPVAIATSGTSGAAILTFEFGGVRRELLVVVGNPPASELPAVLAPVVGVRVP